jgi:hypothetical protein
MGIDARSGTMPLGREGILNASETAWLDVESKKSAPLALI